MMEVTLTKKTGLTGIDTTKSWRATLLNDQGQIVAQTAAITADGALANLERNLNDALRAVQEMRGRESKTE